MSEAVIAIGFGLLLLGILFLILWDSIKNDKDDDDPKPPTGGGGGSTSHAVRTATIGGGIGGV